MAMVSETFLRHLILYCTVFSLVCAFQQIPQPRENTLTTLFWIEIRNLSASIVSTCFSLFFGIGWLLSGLIACCILLAFYPFAILISKITEVGIPALLGAFIPFIIIGSDYLSSESFFWAVALSVLIYLKNPPLAINLRPRIMRRNHHIVLAPNINFPPLDNRKEIIAPLLFNPAAGELTVGPDGYIVGIFDFGLQSKYLLMTLEHFYIFLIFHFLRNTSLIRLKGLWNQEFLMIRLGPQNMLSRTFIQCYLAAKLLVTFRPARDRDAFIFLKYTTLTILGILGSLTSLPACFHIALSITGRVIGFILGHHSMILPKLGILISLSAICSVVVTLVSLDAIGYWSEYTSTLPTMFEGFSNNILYYAYRALMFGISTAIFFIFPSFNTFERRFDV